jgi:hypothetical protein
VIMPAVLDVRLMASGAESGLKLALLEAYQTCVWCFVHRPTAQKYKESGLEL